MFRRSTRLRTSTDKRQTTSTPMNDGQRRRWRFYKSPQGTPVARREYDEDLPDDGRAGIARLMLRYRSGETLLPREITHYKGGLYALKFSWAHNEYRCYFAPDGPYNLALAFAVKKTEAANLQKARDRLSVWRAEGRARRRLAEAAGKKPPRHDKS